MKRKSKHTVIAINMTSDMTDTLSFTVYEVSRIGLIYISLYFKKTNVDHSQLVLSLLFTGEDHQIKNRK